jgi:hypothetical protein
MRYLAAMTFLMTLLSFQSAAQLISVDGTTEIAIDSRGETFEAQFGGTANLNIATQDALTTYNGYQYVGFFNADQRLCLARRKGREQVWEKFIFSDFLKTSKDAHNGISIGICANDGTIHISFDHHADPLNYKVSVPGLANEPDSFVWEESLFSEIKDNLVPGQAVIHPLTYPRFVPSPDGNLQFIYRLGGAGNGSSRIAFYDGLTSQWTADHEFISKEGIYSDTLMGESVSRSQYHNHIMYDKWGTLYTSFTWRERSQGSGTRYNHDIAYLWSEDQGVSWLNNAYEVLADTSTGMSAHLYSPGIDVVNVAPAYRMINNQGHTVDPRGGVHVIMHHTDEPRTTYGFAGTATYRHHWRNAQGQWRTTTLPYVGGRPKLLCDSLGNLILIYIYRGSLYVVTASPSDHYTEWYTLYQERFFSDRFNVDSHRFYQLGELHILAQIKPDSLGSPSPIFLMEFDLAYRYSCYDTIGPCPASHRLLIPNDDCYVRDGNYANDAFGFSHVLEVQAMESSPDETALIYLRFKLDELPPREWISRARLKLYVSDYESEAVENQWYNLFFSDNDFWNEQVTTYNFLRPQPSELLGPQRGAIDSVEWDLTPFIKEKIVKRNWLTLIIAPETASTEWLRFFSKESADPDFHPRLELDYASNYIHPVEDAFVRNGNYADEQYGHSSHLAVKSSPGEGFDRISFLKFDVSEIRHIPVKRAYLQLEMRAMSAKGHTTPYAAFTVHDNTWSEDMITWNNMPPIDSAVLDAHFGRGLMHWDVTSAFQTAMNGDEEFSVALKSLKEGSPRNILLHSNKSTNAKLRPRLILQIEEDSSIITGTQPISEPSNFSNNKLIKVYPNPSQDGINVQMDHSFDGYVTVHHITGKLMTSSIVQSKQHFYIPMEDYPNGIYVLSLRDQHHNFVAVEKVIKSE